MSLKQQLPPLEPLVAFEASARLLSFTRAAQELNLTQAAISQQIRSLEGRLGVQLFIREHRSVRLSPAGVEYQHTVSNLLKHLASATNDIRADDRQQRITVSADQSFSAMWLAPNMAQFRELNSDISVRLIASDDDTTCTANEVQIAILHGPSEWPGFEATKLFDEEVYPVCSPHYFPDASLPISIEQLAQEALLDLEDSHWNWVNWRMWLSANDVDSPLANCAVQINSYPLIIEAAANGMGIALGWDTLVDDALAKGALVRPVEASIRTEFGYYLLARESSALQPGVDAFRSWLLDCFSNNT